MPNYKTMMDLPYLGAYSLEGIKGQELTVTIKDVMPKEIIGEGGLKSIKPVLYFHGDVKPMILNSTNAKTISALAGSTDTDKWIGLHIIVFASRTRFGKDMVDCLRIRPFLGKNITVNPSPTPTPSKCADCGKPITTHTTALGKTVTAEQIITGCMNKYKRALCFDCAGKAAELMLEAQPDDTAE